MTQLTKVSELKERYGIGKQAEINRRKHLRINPTKIEGIYYVTEDQLKLLDLLDHWLTKEGGKMADFDPSKVSPPIDSTDRPTGLNPEEDNKMVYQEATLIDDSEIEQQPDWEGLIGLLAEKISPSRSPLQNWRELEEACEKGWLLTTKQVHELVGSKPYGSKWERGAFIFTKAGKIGRETAWEIEKKV